MTKQKQPLQLFFENNERAKKLPTEDYETYLKLTSYMLHEEPSIVHVDIMMAQALDEFETAVAAQRTARGVTGKQFSDYVRKLKKQIKFSEELEVMRKKDFEKFVFNGIWFTVCTFLTLLFVKELLTERYLVSYYVDMIVGVVALVLAVRTMLQHRRLIMGWGFSNRSWIMELMGVIVSLIVLLLTLSSPFDITFLILVMAHIAARKIIKREFEQVL